MPRRRKNAPSPTEAEILGVLDGKIVWTDDLRALLDIVRRVVASEVDGMGPLCGSVFVSRKAMNDLKATLSTMDGPK